MSETPAIAHIDEKTILNALVYGVVIQDGAGQITFANTAAQRILGAGPEKLQEMYSPGASWHPQREDGTPITSGETPVGRVRATGKPQHGVLALEYHDGIRHVVDVNAVPILGSNQQVEQVVITFTDLTQQRATEAALRQSEERFRTFIDHLSIGAALIAPDATMLYINATGSTLLGVDREEVKGRSAHIGAWWAIREDGSRLLPEEGPTGQVLATRKPARNMVVGMMNNARSEPVWMETSAVPQIDAEGRFAGVIVTFADISARKQSEATNALYAELLRHLPIGFTAWQADNVEDAHSLRLIAANAATVRFAGKPLDSMIGRTIDECYPGVIERDTNQSYLKVLHMHQPVELGDFPYVDSLGAPAFLSVLMFPLPNNSLGVLTEDVTDRKRAAEHAELLSAIVESSTDAIIGKTLDGIITSWNRGAEHIYGYTAAEVLGRPIVLLVPPDRPDEVPMILRRIRDGERITHYETRRVRKDGIEISMALTISPIKDEHDRIVGASTIARDITAQKAADDRIHRQIDQLSALRSIDVSITGSYDMRISLNVVLEQVMTCLGVDAAAVLLLDPATQMLTHAAGRGFRGKEIAKTRIRLGEGLPGAVALDRKRMGMPVLPVNRFIRVKMLQEESFTSYFAAPLKNKGQILGVLELFTRRRIDPDEEWYDFFDAIADQAAIAISDATLFDDLQRGNADLRLAYDATLEGWSRALDLRDKETEGHSRRVTEMTMQLARQFELREDDMIQVRRGALLHDIGKLGVPDGILLKPGPLTEDEWVVMRRHPTFAYDLLQPIKYLRPAIDIPYCHHEKWDGSGYPRGLRDTRIPLAARIFAVVDVWDALSSNRPYRAGWPEERVRAHIAAGAATHFDPEVVTAFLAMEWPVHGDEDAETSGAG